MRGKHFFFLVIGVEDDNSCVDNTLAYALFFFTISFVIGVGDETGCGENTLAYASHCMVDEDDRPVFGYIQVCHKCF